MANIRDIIGIAISTKNRWYDLEITLSQLKANGLDVLETIVINDGGSLQEGNYLKKNFPWVQVVQYEKSEGVLVQRNRLAQLISKPIILQLDDDSFPIEGDLEGAAKWLIAHPKVAALGFQIQNGDSPIMRNTITKPPFQIRDFIGCGAMIKRDIFLRLGGYEEILGFYLEESEFSLKAIQEGFQIYAYPSVVIQHNASRAERNPRKRIRALTQNECLFALWYFPVAIAFITIIYRPLLIFIKSRVLMRHIPEMFMGWIRSLKIYITHNYRKKRMSLLQFREWKKLRSSWDALKNSVNKT